MQARSIKFMRNYRLSKQTNKGVAAAMPVIGPSSYEEAMERIDNGIVEMENGGGYSWEEVKAELLQSMLFLRTHYGSMTFGIGVVTQRD